LLYRVEGPLKRRKKSYKVGVENVYFSHLISKLRHSDASRSKNLTYEVSSEQQQQKSLMKPFLNFFLWQEVKALVQSP
jgi:hypothetical protein